MFTYQYQYSQQQHRTPSRYQTLHRHPVVAGCLRSQKTHLQCRSQPWLLRCYRLRTRSLLLSFLLYLCLRKKDARSAPNHFKPIRNREMVFLVLVLLLLISRGEGGNAKDIKDRGCLYVGSRCSVYVETIWCCRGE